jgi:NTP pyrophosphatase (non-canonical NTP hydrolase)
MIKGRVRVVNKPDEHYIFDKEGFICGTSGVNKEKLKDLIKKVNDSIQLKNIDLTGLSLVDELEKRDEEYKEFADAIITYLYDTNGITKEHLKEEACDVIQVVLSVLKILDIEVEEITEYWNTKHLEKLKDRPRRVQDGIKM